MIRIRYGLLSNMVAKKPLFGFAQNRKNSDNAHLAMTQIAAHAKTYRPMKMAMPSSRVENQIAAIGANIPAKMPSANPVIP